MCLVVVRDTFTRALIKPYSTHHHDPRDQFYQIKSLAFGQFAIAPEVYTSAWYQRLDI